MRKTKEVVITTEGRDKGRAYLITEMSASQAERWAARALLALVKSGADIPKEAIGGGMAGVAMAGLNGFMGLSFAEIEPLMDEMMTCVQIVAPATTRKLIEDDIEEVATRVLLRAEVLEVHLGFTLSAALSKYRASLPAAPNSSNTRTSRKPSARSSRAK